MQRARAIGPVRIGMRGYFSSYLLWAAEDNAVLAGVIEAAHEGRSRFDIKHRGHVLAAILCAANFLEAMINELYQDAHDGHGTNEDGYIAPMGEQVRSTLAELWRGTAEGSKLRPLEKYQLLLVAAGKPRLDQGAAPYQDAQLVVQLRNEIAHYQPEIVYADAPTTMDRRLRGKFADNRLMAGSGNAWWPDHCLGHGCAHWACTSVAALADNVSGTLGLRPNYVRMREGGWQGYGRAPGAQPPAPTQP